MEHANLQLGVCLFLVDAMKFRIHTKNPPVPSCEYAPRKNMKQYKPIYPVVKSIPSKTHWELFTQKKSKHILNHMGKVTRGHLGARKLLCNEPFPQESAWSLIERRVSLKIWDQIQSPFGSLNKRFAIFTQTRTRSGFNLRGLGWLVSEWMKFRTKNCLSTESLEGQ